MAARTIPTRIMIISDTHEHDLDIRHMPPADVLLHTGDLTNFGDLDALRAGIKMLASIPAKLKLVIAGNHDILLDPFRRVENMTDEEYGRHHALALQIMRQGSARKAGIHYLEEGTHIFYLDNGAKFTVYASPYTPGSGGWAFPYQPLEDRFNDSKQTKPNRSSIATKPIPSGVDIVMTHGPPHSILDQVDGDNLGCPNLLRAVSRVRPLMHCFGHIHEGHGANIVTWKPDGSMKNPGAATPLETEQVNEYPAACEWRIRKREQTLMVNAAVMANTATGMKPRNVPFIVMLDLEAGTRPLLPVGMSGHFLEIVSGADN
ncbi:ser/Thr protein phosphatase family protein-like protein [Rhexocercosporidium sp. MPI-PUGE-AT-0058]|nr:ser/Thr protein phosphatase family protein-like protein [Rhexocercosporidium sp. MPI-PUGE-AT-0058]